MQIIRLPSNFQAVNTRALPSLHMNLLKTLEHGYFVVQKRAGKGYLFREVFSMMIWGWWLPVGFCTGQMR